MTVISDADIDAAAARIRGTVARTPLLDVSQAAGRPLRLKCENLQIAGSFKLRGAFNLIAALSPAERGPGGDHVLLGEPCAGGRVRGARRGQRGRCGHAAHGAGGQGGRGPAYGAEVQFEGTTSIERRARAEREAHARGLLMIPPFDHPAIIAGQATVGREIVEDAGEVARVFVPVGGGGLLAGVAAAVKQARPAAQVIGVEPVGAACLAVSLAAGRPVTLERTASVADGLLPVRPGDLTFAAAEALVDDVVQVPDAAIERAVAWLCRHAKLVAEPSGAAATAAALAAEADPAAGLSVAVVSGGNVAPAALADLLRKAPGDAPA